MAMTPFEMYKAQADVLVPIVRALLKEMGPDPQRLESEKSKELSRVKKEQVILFHKHAEKL